MYRATSTYEDVTLITTAYGRCYLENGLYLRFPPEMAIMEVYFRGEVYKVRPIKGGMCGIYKRGETEPYSTGRNVKEAVDNMIKDKSNDGCR